MLFANIGVNGGESQERSSHLELPCGFGGAHAVLPPGVNPSMHLGGHGRGKHPCDLEPQFPHP